MTTGDAGYWQSKCADLERQLQQKQRHFAERVSKSVPCLMSEQEAIALLCDLLCACERCCEAGDLRTAWTWYGTFSGAWSGQFRHSIPRSAEGMADLLALLARVQELLQASKKEAGDDGG